MLAIRSLVSNQFVRVNRYRKFASEAAVLPKYVVDAPATQITTLDSGMRVASDEMIGSQTATVGVWIDNGSRYESAQNNGISHLMEHMAFQGTSKRTQKELQEEIENIGGQLHAYTSREQTVYYAKVFKSDVNQAVEILSDILLNPKLDEAAIEQERNKILHEISEKSKQQPQESIFDHLHSTAFQGNGLGRSIIGSIPSILSLKKDDLSNYIATQYQGPRMVLVGAGGVEHGQLCDLANEHFGKLPGKDAALEVKLEPARFIGSDVRVRFDSHPDAHVALAYKSTSWTSEHVFPLMVLQTMLGSYDRKSGFGLNSSSKMVQEIAQNDLAYSVSTFNLCYKETGLFGIYMVAADNKLDDLLWFVTNNLVRMVHEPSEQELNRAKASLKTTVLKGLDGHSNGADNIGRQLLTYGRRMTPAEMFSRIDSVNLKDIMSTAVEVIHDKDHALAAVGGIHELPDYAWIRRHSYWLRY